MTNNWEIFERCSNAMADYKMMFGKNVPLYLMFEDMETITTIVEQAINDKKELENK